MPFVTGFLKIRGRRGGGHPDQGLPDEEGAVDPDYGIDDTHPDQGLPGLGLPPIGGERPGHGLPRPPPGVFPPLTPSHPIQPAPPGTPPGTIWPPIYGGGHPDQGLPPTGGAPPAPDQGLPPAGGRPVRPDQGLPKPQTYWLVAGIPGVGWRYVAVDPSLVVGLPIPPHPEPK
ncbi:MAG TPA: hypothetical protein VK741_22845 [Acetobacteraceae bacterium]|jgi:hypothetical protein|nr:hypothetical protein [Acetobacteraceae bacterium]